MKKQILKYLTKENQYYPTPKELINDILAKVDESNRYDSMPEEIHFLEPCAGDGEICRTVRDYFKEEHKRIEIKIKCIEIEPTLRNSLTGQGFNVISSDFEKFDGKPFYDLIIMNPPFSKGARFLLKAYSLLTSGGRLVCILNAETIKNKCTKEREQLSHLIERTGEVEFIGNAFQSEDTERNTDTEIAVVYLQKPAYENEFDPFGGINDNVLTEEEKAIDELKQRLSSEGTENSQLITFDKVENAINLYRNCTKQIFSGIDTIQQIKTGLSYLNKEAKEFDINLEQFFKIILENEPEKAKEESIKVLRKMIWSYVIKFCNMDQYLFHRQRQDFYDKLDKGSGTLPFTKDNINQFFSNLFLQKNEYFKQGIEDLFNEITSYHNGNTKHSDGWKTNKNWKINKKIIVKWGLVDYTDYSKYSRYDSKNKYGKFDCKGNYDSNWVDDLDKIVRKIQPIGSSGLTIKDALNNRFKSLGTVYVGESYDNTAETPYFNLKFWKKGTLHIVFKDNKILEELNLIGAKLRRDLGYDDYGKKPVKE